MRYYENRNFIKLDGNYDFTMIPNVLVNVFQQYGYKENDITQYLLNNAVIYSTEYFTNVNSAKYRNQNYARHWNTGSWCPTEHRGDFFHFFERHDLMFLYKFVEKVIKSIK